jgi:hypothetical protein
MERYPKRSPVTIGLVTLTITTPAAINGGNVPTIDPIQEL